MVTYVIPTVDVESASGLGKVKDPLSRLVYGITDEDEYGIRFIMSTLKKYGFKATFSLASLK